jgi:hypothetical protein
VPRALQRLFTQGQFAHGRSDAIGTDEEIVFANRAIREFDGDATLVLCEGYDRCAEANRYASSAVEQHLLKLCAFDTDALAHVSP